MTDNFANNGDVIFKNEQYNVKWINDNNFAIFGQLDQLDFNKMPKGHKNIVYNRSLLFYDFIERDCKTYNINELLCEFIVLVFLLILVCYHMLQTKEVILYVYLFWNIFECYFLFDHLMVIRKYTKILNKFNGDGRFLSNIGFVGNICNDINTFGKYNSFLESAVGSITTVINIVVAIYFTYSKFVNFANIVLYQLIISGCIYIYYQLI